MARLRCSDQAPSHSTDPADDDRGPACGGPIRDDPPTATPGQPQRQAARTGPHRATASTIAEGLAAKARRVRPGRTRSSCAAPVGCGRPANRRATPPPARPAACTASRATGHPRRYPSTQPVRPPIRSQDMPNHPRGGTGGPGGRLTPPRKSAPQPERRRPHSVKHPGRVPRTRPRPGQQAGAVAAVACVRSASTGRRRVRVGSTPLRGGLAGGGPSGGVPRKGGPAQ